MKKATLRALDSKNKNVEGVSHEFNILIETQRRCKRVFKELYEARTWSNVNTQATRLEINALTIKDVLDAVDANGVVNIETLVDQLVKKHTRIIDND